jgi:hypothetical protein
VSQWESDLLVIHPTGWVDEVEVKVSVSDFRAELAKKSEKHESLERGYSVKTRYDYAAKEYSSVNLPTIIRRFWFAMPREVYNSVKDSVPSWAEIGRASCRERV